MKIATRIQRLMGCGMLGIGVGHTTNWIPGFHDVQSQLQNTFLYLILYSIIKQR